jgi:DNA polymerase III psi subunit
MSQNIIPTCPTGCDSTAPLMDFDLCNPAIYFGEIEKLYLMARDGAVLEHWNDIVPALFKAELEGRISNSSVSVDAIREMHVSADMPEAAKDEIIISLGRKAYSPATHTLNVDIDDLSDLNYEAMRNLECNYLVKIWFATKDHIYGGAEGIEATAKLSLVIERGQKAIQKLKGTVTWEAKFSPERADNPL